MRVLFAIGNEYLTHAFIHDPSENLSKASGTFEALSRHIDPNIDPYLYALVKMQLGTTRAFRAEFTSTWRAELESSAQQANDALVVFTIGEYPLRHLTALYNRGIARTSLADRVGDTKNTAKEAADDFNLMCQRASRRIHDRSRVTDCTLARALALIVQHRSYPDNQLLEEASRLLTIATIQTPRDRRYAVCWIAHGELSCERARAANAAKHLKEAVEHFQRASSIEPSSPLLNINYINALVRQATTKREISRRIQGAARRQMLEEARSVVKAAKEKASKFGFVYLSEEADTELRAITRDLNALPHIIIRRKTPG